jgi:DNA-binding LacI/PurR family transcriptional regulator
LESLFDRDYRVPRDIPVIGYDDIQSAAYFSPPLTTVRQDKKRLGQEAVGLLLDIFRGKLGENEPKDIIIDCELIVRGTT